MLPSLFTLFADPSPVRTHQRRQFFVRPVFVLAALVYLLGYLAAFFVGDFKSVITPLLVLASLFLGSNPVGFQRVFPWLLITMMATHIVNVYFQGTQTTSQVFLLCLLSYLAFDRWRSFAITVLLLLGLGVAIFIRQQPDEWHLYVGLATNLVVFWWLIDGLFVSGNTLKDLVKTGQRALLVMGFMIVLALVLDLSLGRGLSSYLVQANLVKILVVLMLLALSLRRPTAIKALFVVLFLITVLAAVLSNQFVARMTLIIPLAMVSWFLLAPAAVALFLSALTVVAIFVVQTPWLVGEGFGYTWRFFSVLITLTVAFYFYKICLEKGEPQPTSAAGFAGVFGLERDVFAQQLRRFSKEFAVLVGLMLAVFLLYVARHYVVLYDLAPMSNVALLTMAPLVLEWWSSISLETGRLLYFVALLLIYLLVMMFWARQQIIYRRLILLEAIEDAAHLKQNVEALAQKADEANLIKTTFINNVSRDIRTPLNSVFGGIVMLEQRLENPGASWREPLNIIIKSAGRLLQMVESVLDLTRMFASSDTLNIQAFHLASLKLELWPALLKIAKTRGCSFYPPTIPATMTPQWLEAASQRGLDLNTNLLPPDLDVIYVDEAKFFKVLERLITDLLGLSSGGFVQVSYSLEASITKLYITAPQVVLPEDFIVSLRATLSHEEMMRGLLSLKQTDQVSLSLCRTLLKEMGGDLVVHSAATTGAALTMVLPAQMPTDTAPKSVE